MRRTTRRPRPDPEDAATDVMLLPELVVTPRLVLRRWEAADVPALSAAVARNLEHLRPWMSWIADEPVPDGERRRMVERWERSWWAGGDAVLGVFLAGEVVGGCGLHRRRGPHGLEIGYWIDAGHLRRGFATEVAGALTDAAFDVPGVSFVEIRHDRRNVASGAVPRRLGYVLVAERPDLVSAPGEEGVDCAWRTELVSWRARRRSDATPPGSDGPA